MTYDSMRATPGKYTLMFIKGENEDGLDDLFWNDTEWVLGFRNAFYYPTFCAAMSSLIANKSAMIGNELSIQTVYSVKDKAPRFAEVWTGDGPMPSF